MEFPTDSTFPMSSDSDTESSSDNETLKYFVSVYNELDTSSSRPKKKMVDRDRIRANEVLMNDYFVEIRSTMPKRLEIGFVYPNNDF
ncbi:hypothetical protein Hanom_Chr11g01057811 [Helianthus anomalus]